MTELGDKGKIGIFDSGFGGLTVLKSLIERLPEESYVYLGDSARLPYGTKSQSTIRRYLEQNIQFLLQQRVKAIVVACNSASSVLKKDENFPIPVLGVIEPGARAALGKTKNSKIGVIATKATVSENAYVRAIQSREENTEVYQQACPLFVPLVEEGLEADPLTNLIVHRYLNPLLLTEIDTLILGCTHYPVLSPAIEKVVRGRIQLIDSGQALAAELEQRILEGEVSKSSISDPAIEIYATDTATSFQQVAENIMRPIAIPEISWVDLTP